MYPQNILSLFHKLNLLTRCLVLLPLYDSVVVLCFAERYFDGEERADWFV